MATGASSTVTGVRNIFDTMKSSCKGRPSDGIRTLNSQPDASNRYGTEQFFGGHVCAFSRTESRLPVVTSSGELHRLSSSFRRHLREATPPSGLANHGTWPTGGSYNDSGVRKIVCARRSEDFFSFRCAS